MKTTKSKKKPSVTGATAPVATKPRSGKVDLAGLANQWYETRQASEDIGAKIQAMKAELEKKLLPYREALESAQKEEALTRETLLKVMEDARASAFFGNGWTVTRRRAVGVVIKDASAVLGALEQEKTKSLASQLMGVPLDKVVDVFAPRQISKLQINELSKRYVKYAGESFPGTERVESFVLALGKGNQEDSD